MLGLVFLERCVEQDLFLGLCDGLSDLLDGVDVGRNACDPLVYEPLDELRI